MCTAVVGGSIQRAATRISTVSDHSSSSPMTSQLATDRRKLVRGRILASGIGAEVTVQNNSPALAAIGVGINLLSVKDFAANIRPIFFQDVRDAVHADLSRPLRGRVPGR